MRQPFYPTTITMNQNEREKMDMLLCNETLKFKIIDVFRMGLDEAFKQYEYALRMEVEDNEIKDSVQSPVVSTEDDRIIKGTSESY